MADMKPMLPIIDVIQAQMQTAYEDEVLRAVQKVGVIVDKERLIQALTTAKKFYEEGYRAAMNGADVVEVVRCKDCKHGVWDEDVQMCKCVFDADYDTAYDEYFGLVAYEEADFYCGRGERRDNNENP